MSTIKDNYATAYILQTDTGFAYECLAGEVQLLLDRNAGTKEITKEEYDKLRNPQPKKPSKETK